MKVLALVQARMSSKRLPGKVMRPILGRPMILRQLERVSRSNGLDRLIIATSDDASDDGLANALSEAGFGVYRGNLYDVLERFYLAAKLFVPAHVLRLTADCPLADPEIIDRVVQTHIDGGFDYTSNVLHPTYPDGLDAEMMRFDALEAAYREASLPSEREHVTSFLYSRPERFKIGSIHNDEDHSALRWTVDEPEDLEFVEAVYERLYPGNPGFGMNDVLGLLRMESGLKNMNSHFERNAGSKKSASAEGRGEG